VVIRNCFDEILFLQRAGSVGEGTWSVPGGWIDPGEHARDTAVREMKEEVDLEVSDLSLLGCTTVINPDGQSVVSIWYEARRWSGKVRNVEPHKATNLGWYSASEIPEPRFNHLTEALRQGFLYQGYIGPSDAETELLKLREAVRKHMNMRGDDRCTSDDHELYEALPEGDTRPEHDTLVTLENCKKYIACRQNNETYVSPQVRIEALEASLREAARIVRATFGAESAKRFEEVLNGNV
jgi:8-oxo-dGTP diphosphatase